VAATVLFNTTVAAAAAMIAWLGVEKLRDGHATTLGAASGAIAGLVGITPACNVVTPVGAIVLGLIVGGACAFAVSFKTRFGYDDSLDVVGIHLVGGVIGSLLVGILASQVATGEAASRACSTAAAWPAGQADGRRRGRLRLLLRPVLRLGLIVDRTIGFRISEEEELQGVDETTHAETGYELGGIRSGGFAGAGTSRATSVATGAGRVQA
jgi:Amt family ammonium transporter